MQYCRYEAEEGPAWGVLEDREGQLFVIASFTSPDNLESAVSIAPVALSSLTLLAPVTPSKIVCVGRNYRDHAKELGNDVPAEPLLFYKPPSSLLAPGGIVVMPKVSERVDFEGELAVVIAQRARKLKRGEDLQPYIRGFTLANDVTARDLQKKDGQWARAKGFDTFCPVGPIVNTTITLAEVEAGLTIETHVNGELRQHGSTSDFIFSLPVLLEYITAAITLEPGDLLLTGTPAGVGPLKPGDEVTVSIPGLGQLTNPFQLEED